MIRLLKRVNLNEEPLTIKNAFIDEFSHLKPGGFHSFWYHCYNFFEYLIKNKIYQAENPIQLVPKRKLSKKEPNPFSKKEVETILREASKGQEFIYELLLNTGIRVDELCHLRFSDFNREKLLLRIRDRAAGGGSKGDKERQIPILKLLYEKYQVYISDHRSKKAEPDFIFLNIQGEKLTPSVVYHRMQYFGDKLGIHIHPHRFRYTYARKLAQEGVHIRIIQKLLGHENIQTTARYIAVDLEDMRQAQTKTFIGEKATHAKEIERLNREREEMLHTINEMQEIITALQEQIKRLK